jgi:uncharacterized membrane protein
VLTVLDRGYAAAAVLWAIAIVWAPWIEQTASGPRGHHSVAALVYAAGTVICHQRPERSFAVAGVQMPVCARCTGIYVGAAAVGAALFLLRRQAVRPVSGSFISLRRPSRVALAMAAVLPTTATLLFEWTTSDMPSNAVRFAAGVPIGALVSWIAVTWPRPAAHSE